MPTGEEVRLLLRRLEGESAGAIESEVVECKPWESDPKLLIRILRENTVCLANHRGGCIVIGIRDDVKSRKDAIQGVGKYDLPSLRRGIYEGTDPHILVEIEELIEPEGTLLLVHVPRGMPPHTTSDGMAKIRIGTDCKPLTGRALAQLLAKGGQIDPTAEIIPGVRPEDLDASELSHLRSVVRREAQSAGLGDLDDLRLLEAVGLLTHEGVTLAGLLLVGSASSLQKHVPQHEVTFLRYRKGTKYDQRRDFRGPLLSVLREMEQLVSLNNRVHTVQEEGFGHLEFPDLSWQVARESVLNAVTHRDYFVRQGVQVSLFQDRFEVTSPGGFVGGVNPENILRHPPVHRNELLARAFQTIGLVNRVGLGVDRIYEDLLLMGKDLPTYTGDESHVRLSIPLETHEGFALFVSVEKRKGAGLDLDDLILLRALSKTPTLDRWVAARILQSTEDEAAKRLVRLREAGYLIVWGRGRGSSYGFRRDLADRLRGRASVDSDLVLEREGVKLRIVALLQERGRLTNSEIRRFSGFNRLQVYALMRELAGEGKLRMVGRGRGGHILPIKEK